MSKNICSAHPKNIEQLKQTLLNKTINYLTIENIYVEGNICLCDCTCMCGKKCTFKLTDIIRNRKKSCGCANSTEFKSKIAIEWCKNNPEKIKEKAKKYSEWCKNNPEKVKEKAEKVSKFYKEHPEVAISNGEKISEWCKDNPEKIKIRVEKYKQWVIEDKAAGINTLNNAAKKWHEEYRKQSITEDIIKYIYKDDIQKLLNGEFKLGSDWIRSKCPICGNYDKHPIQYVFSYNKKELNLPLPMCIDCQRHRSTSKTEQAIAEYISFIYDGKCIKHNKDIISPYELDLYYPEKKIAIEFNGLYWHSEQLGKDKYYHYNKFKLCKEKGIRLISIFEQDWLNKEHKVKQIIKNIFNIESIIYARKCTLKQLDYNIKSEFINNYHFDGDSVQGSIAYGLYYNNELVSCMTFGKLRGQNSLRNDKAHYELVRFVTKSGLCVVGAVSKLFKHFIKEYNPKYILCYSDNDFFTGNVYNKLGFKLKSLGEKSIDYQWCKNNYVLSRQQCMSFKLLQKYPQYKESNIIGSKEKYIMEDLGYYRVYRCGNSIWEWYSS